MWIKFKKALHTLVVSDLHLTIAQSEPKRKPLWKKFNRRDYFIDEKFAALLKKATQSIKKEIELVLAGDIFDFDSVFEIPQEPEFRISWLEKKRGLNSEELKSLHKIDKIIEQHAVFFQALHEFLTAGNKLVFIIGNHDLELHWPSVKERVIQAIGVPETYQSEILFCTWFYISNGDTLIEHGNQYDPYCAISDPINPYYCYPRNAFIKLPFGNLVHRYMVNGMGIFNPHVDTTYLMSFMGYLKFYLNTIRTQPLLLFDWFFGAMATWFVSIRDSFLPPIKNPLTLENQYAEIANNSNTEPSVVRTLKELHATPVSWQIFKVMRVLWLDRALLFVLLIYSSFQLVGLLHIFWGISFWWTLLVMGLFSPLFLLYVYNTEAIRPVTKIAISNKIIKLATKITKVSRMICGHTHAPERKTIDGIEYLNTGYWSPSFKDPNCTIFEKNKSFVWIRPGQKNREAKLMFWDNDTGFIDT